MSVVVAIEDVGVCRKQLKIEVPAPAVQAELQRVTEEYRRQARLPGFRKGKVPLAVVRKRFEKDIRQEVIDRLVPRFWRQAEAESELEALLPPTLAEVEFDFESSLVFDAVVEVRPRVELGPIGDFELPQIRIEPTPEEVDQAIEEIRRQHGEWVDVKRGAARGDLVAGELTRLGEDEAAATSQPVSFEVGDPSVWEELTLAATGQSAGGEVELERSTDGESRRYRLRVDSVHERELPPLDDAFAAQVGDLE
ncbi:MAG: trigger factor, partial [Thermoanaerobaculia bacterium]|nr:trigger factor [Thermoanaerobaculia bacterium]